MFEDVVLVQQTEVGLGQVCHEERAIVGKEGVRPGALLRRGGLTLLRQVLDETYREVDAGLRVANQLEGGRDRAQHPRPLRLGAALARHLEQRPWLQHRPGL